MGVQNKLGKQKLESRELAFRRESSKERFVYYSTLTAKKRAQIPIGCWYDGGTYVCITNEILSKKEKKNEANENNEIHML